MNVFGERQHPEKFIPKCIMSARDGKTIDIHSNKDKTKAGSRHYIHAQDVADGLMFILKLENYTHKGDFGNAKCPKFNLVGPEEIDNLTLAQMIAKVRNKELIYEFWLINDTRNVVKCIADFDGSTNVVLLIEGER